MLKCQLQLNNFFFTLKIIDNINLINKQRQVCVCVAGAVEVRKEGLEAQINRLAELIGRLENKVSRIHTYCTDLQSSNNYMPITLN